MTPEYQVQELYDRCIELEGIRYDLQDKIQEILDFLVHSHITVEEMQVVQEILEKRDNYENK